MAPNACTGRFLGTHVVLRSLALSAFSFWFLFIVHGGGGEAEVADAAGVRPAGELSACSALTDLAGVPPGVVLVASASVLGFGVSCVAAGVPPVGRLAASDSLTGAAGVPPAGVLAASACSSFVAALGASAAPTPGRAVPLASCGARAAEGLSAAFRNALGGFCGRAGCGFHGCLEHGTLVVCGEQLYPPDHHCSCVYESYSRCNLNRIPLMHG